MKKRVLALLVVLAMLLSMLAGCGKKIDLSVYDGVWAEEDLNYENGGFIMTVTTDDDVATLFCEYADEGSGTTSGGVSKEITSKDIRKNVVTIEDAEDDWGNVVDMNITFNEDTIVCEVTEIKDGDAIPVFYKGTYTLVRNEDALQILSETPWEEAMGVKADDYSEEPVYDTSKASGILAQLGMTESEFRNNCYPMQRVTGLLGSITTGDTFFKGEKYTIQDFDMLDRMSDFPTDYENSSYKIVFDVEDKSFNSEGLTYYEGELSNTSIVVYDRRDNTQSPNISINDEICAYCVFTGCYTFSSGQDYLAFVLISVDK